MTQDKNCTTVYFSEYFPVTYTRIYNEIKNILEKYGKEPKLIPYHKDTKVAKELSIWCRDYMPVLRHPTPEDELRADRQEVPQEQTMGAPRGPEGHPPSATGRMMLD